MKHQLYMYHGIRDALIERHCFFVKEAKVRILTHFENVEEDAERFYADEYERIGTRLQHGDEAAGSEFARRRGEEYYELLSDMKTDITLATVAAMYHRWDKDLRDFIQRELDHSVMPDAVATIAWDPNAIACFNLLRDFGWDCANEPFYNVIRDCRLVVNVYKHGAGRSLDDVARLCPQYLKSSLPRSAQRYPPDYQNISVSHQEFEAFADTFLSFWRAFPKRLFAS